MNHMGFKKLSKIGIFDAGRSGIKAYKMTLPQIPTMRPNKD